MRLNLSKQSNDKCQKSFDIKLSKHQPIASNLIIKIFKSNQIISGFIQKQTIAANSQELDINKTVYDYALKENTRKFSMHKLLDRTLNLLSTVFVSLALILSGIFPYSGIVSAQSPEPAPAETVVAAPIDTPAQGPAAPTGSTAPTYVYNEATGLWENEYYTWDPVTHATKPKTPQQYDYNTSTNQWQEAPPAVIVQNSPNPDSLKVDGSTGYVADGNTDTGVKGTGQFANIQPNTTSLGAPSTVNYDIYGNAVLSSNIGSNSASGNANINSNNTVKDVTTGQANAMVNLLNMLNSNWLLSGGQGNVSTFLTNIVGDVYGDLLIDPGAISNSSQKIQASTNPNTDIKLTVKDSGLIDNNIVVNATSGDANLNSNTQVGSGKTGDANATANVVDLMNSSIAAGNSFIGAINIWGNLNGDLLLPDGFLGGSLANSGSTSQAACTTGCSTAKPSEVVANNNLNQKISDQIKVLATSGAINSSDNSKVGNVGSGTANTNVSVFNLTGKDIVGDNAIMVFVNVLGSWYGLILDTPAGQNSALLGGKGSTSSGNNLLDPSASGNKTINTDVSQGINNNIAVNAKSGDINAKSNTSLGDLKTGNANVAVNIFDVINSRMSLSGWFGVLFINVFGTWQGSFGVNTTNGDVVVTPPTPTATQQPPKGTDTTAQAVKTFKGLNSKRPSNYSLASTNASGSGTSANDQNGTQDSDKVLVLGTSTTGSPKGNLESSQSQNKSSAIAKVAWYVLITSCLLAAITIIKSLLNKRHELTSQQSRA